MATVTEENVMKVSEIIELLKKCNQESEIKVLFPFPNRPTGGQLEDIQCKVSN
ncbi:hypothetical protein [Terribacillus saccharophilus]|uniref:hypothetical protein n=1 Tax=Terribacillus saccharophilus TaxID=361277 RepID=UPI002DC95EE8|nr:hypothetical protein [Terribacillus saccharophilus]